ncbi:uncharacterized protein TM35_000151900 [Trypanosoma theileri]|uniref:Uncharacterized protein n=1 Tax=Trypanosoma theileri TaxID=67003 RepID=A0A1X0NX29_9TRYP|nr:uncharacterized protein TM35_000151900 [Trypanosoma theileri]ORC88759.1 hypothetical protein TM35_000151900 [Trypanosoma theileri]
MQKQSNTISNDPQLQKANGFTEAETLLDIMLKKFNSTDRDEADPFLLRVVIAGKRTENAARSLGTLMTELIDRAVSESENPLRLKNETTTKPSGLIIDYENNFIEIIEGYERHIVGFLKLLKKHCDLKEDASCSDVRILFLTDDVLSPLAVPFSCIDKLPALTPEAEVGEKSDEEIAELLLDDINNLVKLSNLVANELTNKRKIFLDSARVSHPMLFPRTSSLKNYLEKDLFLTLSEYVDLFAKVPELTRDVELNHPVEDPLKY